MDDDAYQLGEQAREYLRRGAYDPAAERAVCWLPLGGIYWTDEVPDWREFSRLQKTAQHQVLRLFGVRFKIWRGESLSESEHELWSEAGALASKHPLFRRTELSDIDLAAQAEVEAELDSAWEQIVESASAVKVETKNGIEKFSATFDVRDEDVSATKQLSWWSRLWRRIREVP